MIESEFDSSGLQKEYLRLLNSLGEENLPFEYYHNTVQIEEDTPEVALEKLFTKVKLRYLPSGKIYLGDKFDNQIENAIAS